MIKLTSKLVLLRALKAKLHRRKDAPEENEEEVLCGVTHLHLQDNFVSEIGDISKCTNLCALYLQNNQITQIKNLHSSVNLTHLYLQHNNIEKIENLNFLKNLKKLYLGHNNIAVIEGLDELELLEELQVEKQNLPPGETLYFDPRTVRALASCVKILNISCNHLTSLADIAGLQEVRWLIARSNKIADVSDLSALLSGWLYLTTVEFQGNPVCSQHKYREALIANTSWSLESIDGKVISESTRRFIKTFEQKKIEVGRAQSSHSHFHQAEGSFPARTIRGKSPGYKAMSELQMSVSGRKQSRAGGDETTYRAWQTFSANADLSRLPTPYQKQQRFLQQRHEEKASKPFTAHLPTL